MQNRESPFSSQLYIALNSINVAFYNNKDVINAWKEFRNYVASNPEKDKTTFNNENLRWNIEKNEHFYNLLKKMAKSLNYEFNEDDIKNTSYIPPEIIQKYELDNVTIYKLINTFQDSLKMLQMKSNNETEHRSKLND